MTPTSQERHGVDSSSQPQDDFSSVVRMTRITPYSSTYELVFVEGVGSKHSLLVISCHLYYHPQHPYSNTQVVDQPERCRFDVMLSHVDEQWRHTQEHPHSLHEPYIEESQSTLFYFSKSDIFPYPEDASEEEVSQSTRPCYHHGSSHQLSQRRGRIDKCSHDGGRDKSEAASYIVVFLGVEDQSRDECYHLDYSSVCWKKVHEWNSEELGGLA